MATKPSKAGVCLEALLPIYQNFVFAPSGKGRSRVTLVGVALLTAYCAVQGFLWEARFDSEFDTGNYMFWSLGLLVLSAWLILLPSIVYLMDYKERIHYIRSRSKE